MSSGIPNGKLTTSTEDPDAYRKSPWNRIIYTTISLFRKLHQGNSAFRSCSTKYYSIMFLLSPASLQMSYLAERREYIITSKLSITNGCYNKYTI
jgi:hypothetical protein